MPADTIGFDNRARRRLRDRRSRPGWPIIPHRCGAESIDHLFAANDEDELTRPRRTAILIRAVYGLWIWPLRLARDTRGVVLVLVALLLPVLVGLTGFGVETGLWYAIKRQNQAAADEAALSGAMEVAAAKPDVTAQALCMARWNGFDSSVAFPPCPNALNGATVNNPPTSGTYSGNNSYVEVILSQQQSTLFANFNPINLANITIKTRAVAGPTSSNPACILALADIPNGNITGITLAGSPVTVNTGACSLDTNSTSATSVVFNGHPTLTSYTIVTSGNYSVGGATVTLTTPATTNAPATTDPYANAIHPMPASCLPGTSISTPALPVNNGCYSSISITANAVLPSNSVFYVSGGLFSISGNSTVTGSNVTIVLFNGAHVNISGNTTVTLNAPTAGTWKGILFWEDSATTPACGLGNFCDSFTGGAASSFTGALYFPKGNVDFGGNSGSNCTVLIANTVEFHGTPTLSAAGCAAAGVTPPTNGSGAIALVE
jgi:hypothetical protein